MGDAPQARVRVSPSRFKKLKRTISQCDREIQSIHNEIMLRGVFYTIARISKMHDRCCKLDQKRKIARLEMKGYITKNGVKDMTPTHSL